MARKRPYPATILPARETSSGTAIPAADLRVGEIAVNSADGTLFVKREDGAVAPVGSVPSQVVSSGGLAALTTEQQDTIVTGTIVTTTDGKRWVYTGAGSKTAEASYIELADITPAWASIPDKPTTFTPAAHTHTIANVTGLQTALDGKQATLPAGVDGGEVLTYSGGQWIAQQPSGGGLPSGTSGGDTLSWSSDLQQWVPTSPTSQWQDSSGYGSSVYIGFDPEPFVYVQSGDGSGGTNTNPLVLTGTGITFPDGTSMTTAAGGSGSSVFKGEWSSMSSYSVGDFVEYSGTIYKNVNNFSNPQPDTDPNYWAPIGGGGGGSSTWKGEWQEFTSYEPSDVVTWSGALYIATMSNSGQFPDNGMGYWNSLTGGGGGGGLPSAGMDGVLPVFWGGVGWTTSDDSMMITEVVLGSFGQGASAKAVVSFAPSDSQAPSLRVYDNMGMAFTELMATGVRFADGSTQSSAFTGGYTGSVSIYDETYSMNHVLEFSNGVLTNYYTT